MSSGVFSTRYLPAAIPLSSTTFDFLRLGTDFVNYLGKDFDGAREDVLRAFLSLTEHAFILFFTPLGGSVLRN